jgi:hypothetical protein
MAYSNPLCRASPLANRVLPVPGGPSVWARTIGQSEARKEGEDGGGTDWLGLADLPPLTIEQ